MPNARLVRALLLQALASGLPRCLDQLDVLLLEQIIDELADIDAARLGARRQVGLHLGIKVHRNVQRRAWLEELAARRTARRHREIHPARQFILARMA